MRAKTVEIVVLFLAVFICIPVRGDVPEQIETPGTNTACHEIEIFYSQNCPHCSRALEFLGQLNKDHPQISIIKQDIGENAESLSRFFNLTGQLGIDTPGVPAFLVCNQFNIGFDNVDTTGQQLKQLLGIAKDETIKPAKHVITAPWIGELSLERLGLPLFTIAIGLIDGFNPCAMWVLLFLLSLLVNLRDRTRILLIAGTFVFVSGAVYFAFMAAWLNLFLIIGFSRWLQITIGTLAILIAAIHIKDFFAFHKSLTLSIPDAAKPGLYARMRKVVMAENLMAAMLAVFIIAVLVNFLELLCTAGLPALYTQILTTKSLGYTSYYAYLLLYNLAYIFDDALMVSIVVYSLNRYKIQENQGRWLKLLSGSVILILGILLIASPQILF